MRFPTAIATLIARKPMRQRVSPELQAARGEVARLQSDLGYAMQRVQALEMVCVLSDKDPDTELEAQPSVPATAAQ